MEPMTCSNCGEPLEAGAAFCGNCGHPIDRAAEPLANPTAADSSSAVSQGSSAATAELRPPVAPIAQTSDQPAVGTVTPPSSPTVVGTAGGLPSYAVPIAAKQSSITKVHMAIVLGSLGIIAGLFIPLLGFGLGTAGLVLATTTRSAVKHRLSTAGSIVAVLAILASLASWVYVIVHDPRLNHKPTPPGARTASGAINAQNLITPCYSVNFASRLNIQNNSGSCNMSAFNGTTLDVSSDAYKVYGTVSAISTADFTSLAKRAIENDVHQSLPSFSIVHETAGRFADSPAYFVTAASSRGISVVEAAAWHTTSNGDNFFVFVHAVNGDSVDLNVLQAGWRWE